MFFEAAFKQLHVHPTECKYLAGNGMGGYFVYLRLLFGIVSGPLLWGRVGALAMRATAAMSPPESVRLQCYVDDPILVVGGTPAERRESMLKVIFFWCALGLRLNWKKPQMGNQIQWIRIQVKVDATRREYELAIQADKVQCMEGLTK